MPKVLRYWEYLPPTYSATGQKIPVVVFLHGLGERGDTEAAMTAIVNANGTPPNYVEDGVDFPFVLISPQLPLSQLGWNNKNHINPVVDYVLQNYNVDPDQLYLTGLSLGGGGVWGYAQDPVYGLKVRGIASVCGHQNSTSKACNIANNGIRVWAFHGEADTVVDKNITTRMVDAINVCMPAPNPVAIKTIYPGVGHNAWDNAYRVDHVVHNPNVYEWMMQTFVSLPTANAGADRSVTLPPNSITLTGSGTSSNSTITGYAWQQVSGPSCTLSGTTSSTLSVSGMVQGTYVFSLTVTDAANNASTPDQVTVTVRSSVEISWNSYDIVMQSTPGQQGRVNSADNSLPATVAFYQSSNDGGVRKNALLTTYNPGGHTNVNSFVATYWANGTGTYPYAGKSTVGRGGESGEGNVPLPTGVFDLQLHPPSSAKLIVAAFVVPAAGEYTVGNAAVRRVSSATGTARLKVFNDSQSMILDLQATNNQDWVQSANPLSLGSLTIGDSIFFAVDRDGNFASDFTEVTWKVTMIPSSSQARMAPASQTAQTLPENAQKQVLVVDETDISFYPNPVKNEISFQGITGATHVTFYNAMGALLQQTKIDQAHSTLDINAATFSPGLYIMILKNPGVQKQFKFRVEP
ncbi:MAG TPA: T9SS type A sorting domain-containing protein [Chryseolinea sp.]